MADPGISLPAPRLNAVPWAPTVTPRLAGLLGSNTLPNQGGAIPWAGGGVATPAAPRGGIPPLSDRLKTVQALLGANQTAYPAADGSIYVLESGRVVGSFNTDGAYTPGPNGGAAPTAGNTGEALAVEAARSASAERIAAEAQAGDTSRLGISEAGLTARAAADLAERARENGLTIAEQQRQDAEKAREFGITSGQADQRLGVDNSYNNSRLSLDASTAQAQQDAAAAQLQLTGQNDQANLGITAAKMAADQAVADRTAGLAERTQEAKVLSTPSDWLYRAFQSRGGTAPDAKITTADILNALRGDAASAQAQGQTAVQAARDAASRFVIPTLNSRIVAPTPYVIPPNAGGGGGGTAPAPAAGSFAAEAPAQQASDNAATRAAAASLGIPAAARGGVVRGGRMTHLPGNAPSRFSLPQPGPGMPNGTPPPMPTNAAIPFAAEGADLQGGQPNMAIVGDPKPETPNKPNEELVIDLPNDGGLMVIPKDRLVGTRKVQNNTTDATSRMSDVPHMADGGIVPYQSGTISGAPDYSPVTQDQLVGAAQQYAPPGVTDALAGNQQQTYRLANPNLTPHAVDQLTPDEQTALNTYLGVVDDTSLAQEMSGAQSRFGPQVNVPRSRLSLAGVR